MNSNDFFPVIFIKKNGKKDWISKPCCIYKYVEEILSNDVFPAGE